MYLRRNQIPDNRHCVFGFSVELDTYNKGIGNFGNYHDIETKDLLKVKELKNLSIFQIAKFKSSNVKTETIKIDNLDFPQSYPHVSHKNETRYKTKDCKGKPWTIRQILIQKSICRYDCSKHIARWDIC